MLALYLLDNRELALKETDEPDIKSPRDVKIKMAYSSICGFDIMTLQGKMDTITGVPIGHEGAGVITGLGSMAENYYKIGQRVTLSRFSPCGQCYYCRKGKPHYCLNMTTEMPTMLEHTVYDMSAVWPIPDELSLKEGCLVEPLSVCLNAFEKIKPIDPQNVIIIGAGSIGLLFLKLIKFAMAYCNVCVVEPVKKKREMAKKLGASHVIDPSQENVLQKAAEYTNGHVFDIVLETSGDRAMSNIASSLVDKGGLIVYFAQYEMDHELHFNPFELYIKDCQICGVYPNNAQFKQAISIMPYLNTEELITAEYPFRHALEAFDAKLTGEHAKVMLKFET